MTARLVNFGGPFQATNAPHNDGSATTTPCSISASDVPNGDAGLAFVMDSDTPSFGLGAMQNNALSWQSWIGFAFWFKWALAGDSLEDGDIVGIVVMDDNIVLNGEVHAEYQSASGKYRVSVDGAANSGYDYSPDVWYKFMIRRGPTASPNREFKVYINGSLAINTTGTFAADPLVAFGVFQHASETTGDGDKKYSLCAVLDSNTESDLIADWYAEWDQHDCIGNSSTYTDYTGNGGVGSADYTYINDWAGGGSYSFGASQEIEGPNSANREQAFTLSSPTKTFRNPMLALCTICVATLNAASKTVDENHFIYDGSTYLENGLGTNPLNAETEANRGDVFNTMANGSAWLQSSIATHEIGVARDADAAISQIGAFGAWAYAFGNVGSLAFPRPRPQAILAR